MTAFNFQFLHGMPSYDFKILKDYSSQELVAAELSQDLRVAFDTYSKVGG